jgi:uncharacterized membrane protein
VPVQARRFERESGAFERVAFLTDGVYAIALTLIVVGIGVPVLQRSGAASELWSGLSDHTSEFVSFLIGVLVLGFYWPAHQASFDQLQALDRGYVVWTMLYLGGIAFLPYPIRLVGSYPDNSVAWSMFAANLAVVSGLEAILFAHAWRRQLLQGKVPKADYRWLLLMSVSPVPCFLLSIPVAFVGPPPLSMAVWALAPLAQAFAGRWRPGDLSG